MPTGPSGSTGATGVTGSPVIVTDITGDALGWVKGLVLVNVALGLVLVAVVVALLVVTMWRV